MAELVQLRGGRILIGLQARPEPVAVSFLADISGTEAKEPGAGSRKALVVGTTGAEPVGYGSCSMLRLADGALLGWIEELFVSVGSRRSGLGAAMAQALIDWCKGHGCTGVDASALPGSRAVKSFFESAGFTARALIMHRPLG